MCKRKGDTVKRQRAGNAELLVTVKGIVHSVHPLLAHQIGGGRSPGRPSGPTPQAQPPARSRIGASQPASTFLSPAAAVVDCVYQMREVWTCGTGTQQMPFCLSARADADVHRVCCCKIGVVYCVGADVVHCGRLWCSVQLHRQLPSVWAALPQALCNHSNAQLHSSSIMAYWHP